MEDLQVLTNAIDKATKAGAFSLQDIGSILSSIRNLGQKLSAKNEQEAEHKKELPKLEKELQARKNSVKK